jgi:hypothetical protein
LGKICKPLEYVTEKMTHCGFSEISANNTLSGKVGDDLRLMTKEFTNPGVTGYKSYFNYI